MHRFEVNTLQVHNRGVRDGLMLSMIDQSQGEDSDSTPGVDRDEAIEHFSRACRVEVEHVTHISKLAGKIYRQLAAPLGLAIEDGPLLEAAAKLQDVGYLINYDQHHKHSYHLILNSRLPGFLPEEIEIIANVARYHRGGRPKKKHENYRQLSSRDRLRVKQMAAILRIAGGLDRSHTHQVKDVQVEIDEQKIQIFVSSENHPDVDLWGARRRADLFERVFNYPLLIDWETSEHRKKSKADGKKSLKAENQSDAASAKGDVEPSIDEKQNGQSRLPETSDKAAGK